MKISLEKPQPAPNNAIRLKQPFKLYIEANRGTASGTFEFSIDLCVSEEFTISPQSVSLRLVDGYNRVNMPVQVTINGPSGSSSVEVKVVYREGGSKDVQSRILSVEAT